MPNRMPNLLQWALAVCVCSGELGASQMQPPTSGSQRGPDRGGRSGFNKQMDDRINAAIRKRLELSDDQFARLREVSRRMERERRVLFMDEGAMRGSLRRELLAGADANDSTVSAMLDKMPSIERRRIDLMEREQGELAKFLSPVQRAKYIGLQDELRRSMEDLQNRRSNGGSRGADSLGTGAGGKRRPYRPPDRL